MDCPKCKSAIHAMTLEGVEFDFCSSCKGMWFDKDEMAFMFELKSDVPFLDQVRKEAKKTNLACPRCSQHLEELRFHPLNELLIDRCGSCSGIWLDKAELPKAEKLASQMEDPDSKLLLVCQQLKKKGYQVLGIRKA